MQIPNGVSWREKVPVRVRSDRRIPNSTAKKRSLGGSHHPAPKCNQHQSENKFPSWLGLNKVSYWVNILIFFRRRVRKSVFTLDAKSKSGPSRRVTDAWCIPNFPAKWGWFARHSTPTSNSHHQIFLTQITSNKAKIYGSDITSL